MENYRSAWDHCMGTKAKASKIWAKDFILCVHVQEGG